MKSIVLSTTNCFLHERRDISLSLMQSPQCLNDTPYPLDINTKSLHDFLLQLFIAIQEALNQLAIHKAVWLFALTHRSLVRTVAIKRHITRTADLFCHILLQAHECILVLRSNSGEQVNSTFDCGEESRGDNDGVGSGLDIDVADAIDHFAELHV
ncbi:hypothetical protein KCU77_g90, partial [Aureobasidium melanogenum]